MSRRNETWFEREVARRSADSGLLFVLGFMCAGLLMLGVLAIVGVI